VPSVHRVAGKRLGFVLALGVGVALSRDAGATLGGDAPSIAANERTLGARRTVSALTLGTRHDLVLPSGVVVREYVSPGGLVYAVTWSGPRVPDLRELLGARFSDLAKQRATGFHNRMTLSLDDFEVRAWGHRGFFAGRAWVPSLVPAGVNVDSLVD
jgi:hypothetical protein